MQMLALSLCALQAATIDVEDLEHDASPEDMMLSYVSADRGKVRSSRSWKSVP